MKKLIFVVMFIFVLSGVTTFFQTPSSAMSSPGITAPAAILIDARTGRILYERNKDVLKEPASTTKIMTCLLALEHLPLDKVVTIDAISPYTRGSRIFLLEGEEVTVEQLLYALMLESANDAAVALAIVIAGSVEEFAVMMNDRARELGARSPSYRNPTGLHQEGHYATAYDLAVVSQYAMRNPTFRRIVATVAYTIPETNRQPERSYIHNTNRMLFDRRMTVPVRGVMTPVRYEYTTGIKTGFTPQAGASLVSSAERDGTELIAVVLGTTDALRFGDSIALLEFGFENFFTHRAVHLDKEIDDVRVRRGTVNRVAVNVSTYKYITLPSEASTALISTRIVMDESVTAPVEAGQVLGKIEVYEGTDLIGEVAVVAASDVEVGRFLSRFGVEDSTSETITRVTIVVGSIIGVIVLLFLTLKIRYMRRRQAKRRARALQIAQEREAKQKEMEQRRWPY